jgi:hypothetical protein
MNATARTAPSRRSPRHEVSRRAHLPEPSRRFSLVRPRHQSRAPTLRRVGAAGRPAFRRASAPRSSLPARPVDSDPLLDDDLDR